MTSRSLVAATGPGRSASGSTGVTLSPGSAATARTSPATRRRWVSPGSVWGDFLYEAAWFTFWAPWHPGLAAIDFRTVIRGHYRATGVEVPRFGERLRCYELHIGLTHLAYCAFAGREWEDDLWAVARRTRGILGSDGG